MDNRGRGGRGRGGRGGGGQSDRGGGGRGGGGQSDRGGGGRGGGGYSDRGGGGRGGYSDRGGGGRGGGGYSDRGGRGGGGGGYSDRGGGGGYSDRGGRGGGRGGYRGRGGPAPTYKDPNKNPDPYSLPYTKEQGMLQQPGWKPFEVERKDDVKLQKYAGQPAQWSKDIINVSVNHFAVNSTKGAKTFAIPTLYHYDINYEIIRKRSGQTDKSKQSPCKKKKKVSDDGSSSYQVEEVTVQLRGTGLSDKKKGEKPPNKKLPKHLTKIILDYLIPKIRQEYNHYAIATDGSFNMYSTRRIDEPGSNIPMQYDVEFADLHRSKLMEEEEDGTIKVSFSPSIDKATRSIHTINTADIARFFQAHGTLKSFEFSPELRQTLESACNAFVKSFPNFKYFAVGRSNMVPCDGGPGALLGGGICAWRGLSANIAMGWKPYLNVDIANCTFILDKPVLEVLKEVIRSPPEDVNRWSGSEYEDVKVFLKTCKITYMVGGRRFGGPIRDMGEQSVRDTRFRWEEKNKDISVFDYYKERYNQALKYPDGPILIIRSTAKVPAELCTIKKGQSYNRKLDGSQTTSMLSFAKRDPHALQTTIMDQMNDMKLKENLVLKELGIQIPDRMLSMEARVLVPPALRYGQNNDGQVAIVEPEGGTWEIWSHDYQFYKTTKVDKWGVLVVGCRNIRGADDKFLWGFIDCLKRNGDTKGVVFNSKPQVVVDTDCRKDPHGNAKVLTKHFENLRSKGCQLVVVVFPMKGSPLYGHIKHAAEVDVGILTQCVAEKNVTYLKDATVQNILLKINSKLGGTNHVTVAPFNPAKASKFATILMDCPILIMGADVTHAPPGSMKTVNGKQFVMPSYAAVTGSLDKTCMPFMTEVRAQRKANAGAAEVIQDLEQITVNMLRNFRQWSKGVAPQKIIYFRDGVGEGQFPEVLHVEMTAMRRACKSLSEKYQPKITFITVQKRHKTRIFYHPSPGRTENAPAGTVIDKEIVHPTETDFYLLSHKGMLGTSRPSRYHVLWDDSDFSQDVLQSLAYTLCYMYVRCTKSVKMPAPTYYAHLAADRAKKLCEGFETKHGDPNEENLNRMLKRKVEFIQAYPMHFV